MSQAPSPGCCSAGARLPPSGSLTRTLLPLVQLHGKALRPPGNLLKQVNPDNPAQSADGGLEQYPCLAWPCSPPR